jgi:hypothetical protein
VYVTDRASLYVARTMPLALPLTAVAAGRMRIGNDPVRAVRLPTAGRMELDLPFRREQWQPLGRPEFATLRTFGALYGRSNRRISEVEIELSPWSRDASELLVRPAVRSPYRWGVHRLERWFVHAHAAADSLRSELLARSATVLAEAEVEAVAV